VEDDTPRCPDCSTSDPASPNVEGCESCRDALQREVERAERLAGWDSTP
jgi:hypothetical protein